jgi:hypothetical protein
MEAKFGIYIRDKRFQLCNVMIDNILLDIISGIRKARKKRGAPMGHDGFRKSTTGVLGAGDDTLMLFATFSTFFHEICNQMVMEAQGEMIDWGDDTKWKVEKIFPKKQQHNHV